MSGRLVEISIKIGTLSTMDVRDLTLDFSQKIVHFLERNSNKASTIPLSQHNENRVTKIT